MIEVSKLTVKRTAGAGLEIHAHIDHPVDCGTHVLKGDHNQPALIGCAPWMQFEPKEWADMTSQLFIEMVTAWNEKYGDL